MSFNFKSNDTIRSQNFLTSLKLIRAVIQRDCEVQYYAVISCFLESRSGGPIAKTEVRYHETAVGKIETHSLSEHAK